MVGDKTTTSILQYQDFKFSCFTVKPSSKLIQPYFFKEFKIHTTLYKLHHTSTMYIVKNLLPTHFTSNVLAQIPIGSSVFFLPKNNNIYSEVSNYTVIEIAQYRRNSMPTIVVFFSLMLEG